MFEIFLCLFAIIALVKIAFALDYPLFLWGAISFAAILGSLALPMMPYVRVGLAFLTVLALITVQHVVTRGR